MLTGCDGSVSYIPYLACQPPDSLALRLARPICSLPNRLAAVLVLCTKGVRGGHWPGSCAWALLLPGTAPSRRG